jgi:hypothetical protein
LIFIGLSIKCTPDDSLTRLPSATWEGSCTDRKTAGQTPALPGVEELIEFVLSEDGDAEFLGFIVFGARVGADDDVVGFLADGAGNFAAVLLDEFGGGFARAVGETAGEDEGFAGEFLALDDALFGGWFDTVLVELFDDLLIGRFGEKFGDAGCDFWADFADFEQLFFCGRGEFIER